MKDRGDQASSDELIRRARYGGLDSEQSVAAPTESPTIKPPSAEGQVVRQPLKPATFPGDDAPPNAADPFEPGPRNYAPDAPYDDQAPYVPPPPRPSRSGGGGLQRFGGWIVIGVIALGGLAWGALSNSKPVEDLVVGECIDEPDDDIITSIKTVDCAALHDYEVFWVLEVPYGETASYPGDENLFFEILEMCVTQFDRFVGMDYADSIYDVNAIYPTQESWDELDDREATCLIAQYNSIGNILQVTGSLRNVRR